MDKDRQKAQNQRILDRITHFFIASNALKCIYIATSLYEYCFLQTFNIVIDSAFFTLPPKIRLFLHRQYSKHNQLRTTCRTPLEHLPDDHTLQNYFFHHYTIILPLIISVVDTCSNVMGSACSLSRQLFIVIVSSDYSCFQLSQMQQVSCTISLQLLLQRLRVVHLGSKAAGFSTNHRPQLGHVRTSRHL
jgi:hypothetical protein